MCLLCSGWQSFDTGRLPAAASPLKCLHLRKNSVWSSWLRMKPSDYQTLTMHLDARQRLRREARGEANFVFVNLFSSVFLNSKGKHKNSGHGNELIHNLWYFTTRLFVCTLISSKTNYKIIMYSPRRWGSRNLGFGQFNVQSCSMELCRLKNKNKIKKCINHHLKPIFVSIRGPISGKVAGSCLWISKQPCSGCSRFWDLYFLRG